ncbi:Pleiotropic drug resistance protein 1 [Vitis vinifera]|uniref:Pleiotropic drug resistance protein 1 n=1 Tax=Vitis vinifera TaxID=29760 RepID=A0A438FDZ4_VITVI|nr:Pleiotropic drug resistance protein 1 [Vitis vinifera]
MEQDKASRVLPFWLQCLTPETRRAGSMRWRTPDVEIFTQSSRGEDDKEALKWAALEKLPTYNRLRKGLLLGSEGEVSEVDIQNLGLQEKKSLVERLVKIADEDNEKFLLKLKNRIDRVGIDLPEIEVRFEHLTIDAEAYVGSRALPSFINSAFNQIEDILNTLRILPSRKKKFSILHDVSGIIKPRRMTLLLGPPSSEKTTLLLALYGMLDSSLKVTGRVTYKGHGMNEFVPQRTAAYISRLDTHIGEMTVRETLAFSARCQGVGDRYDMLAELSRREKAANIMPDPDIDAFMKVDRSYCVKFSPVLQNLSCLLLVEDKRHMRNKDLIKELSQPTPSSKDLYFPNQYSQSFTQCMACLWKQRWSYWRNPPYTAVRFFFTTFIALMFGTMFWDLGTQRTRQRDLSNAMGSMYAAVIFLGFQNGQLVQPVVAVEIDSLLQRELQECIHPCHKPLHSQLYFTFFGMMAVAATPNQHIAVIIAAAFYALWNLFSGFIVPRTRIPVWWRWYYWACPVAWTLYGLVTAEFGDIKDRLLDTNVTVKQYLDDYFVFEHDFLGVVAAVIVGFTVLFLFIFTFSIKAFYYQRG